jgi:hypothetical protein
MFLRIKIKTEETRKEVQYVWAGRLHDIQTLSKLGFSSFKVQKVKLI